MEEDEKDIEMGNAGMKEHSEQMDGGDDGGDVGDVGDDVGGDGGGAVAEAEAGVVRLICVVRKMKAMRVKLLL